MNKLSQKSFRIVRGCPYSSEGGCIVYVELLEDVSELLFNRWRSDCQLCKRVWKDIIGYCRKIRGSIYPVMVLSADGRRLLCVRGLKGTLFLPEGVEEVADYAASDENDNEITRIVWNGSIRRIGERAFLLSDSKIDCISFVLPLTTAVLPPTVEFVGKMPFIVNYIVSCQCHCADSMDPYSVLHVCRYKDYRRFLDDMAWIEHICNGYGSVDEFVRDVRRLLEDFDGDRHVLKYVVNLDGVRDFLSSYWNLRRLREVDGQLAELLCLNYRTNGVVCDGFCMLLLEDDSISRKERIESARSVMARFDYCTYGSVAISLPLVSPSLFHEEVWNSSREVRDEVWRYRSPDCLCTNGRRVRDGELLAAIKGDSKSRFMMLLALKGLAVKKTVIAALVAAKAVSCISAAYAQYPKMEKYLPLNDFALFAISEWDNDEIMRLIEAIEREMPGRIAQVKDSLGNNALWYLLINLSGDKCYACGALFGLGPGIEKVAKRLVELGMDPFETTPTGLSWYEIAIGEDDTQNKVVINPRIAFLAMLKKRMMDMGESQGVP